VSASIYKHVHAPPSFHTYKLLLSSIHPNPTSSPPCPPVFHSLQGSSSEEEGTKANNGPGSDVLETDWMRGRRLKKLYQLINGKQATKENKRYVKHTRIILATLLVIHTILFGVSVSVWVQVRCGCWRACGRMNLCMRRSVEVLEECVEGQVLFLTLLLVTLGVCVAVGHSGVYVMLMCCCWSLLGVCVAVNHSGVYVLLLVTLGCM